MNPHKQHQTQQHLTHEITDLIHQISGQHTPTINAVNAAVTTSYPQGGDGGSGGGGKQVHQPTAVAAINNLSNPTIAHHHEITDRLQAAKDELIRAWRLQTKILRTCHTPTTPAPKAGQGPCLLCDRWVCGTDIDRLRRGLCPRCYNRWVGHGKPDLATLKHQTQTETGDETK